MAKAAFRYKVTRFKYLFSWIMEDSKRGNGYKSKSGNGKSSILTKQRTNVKEYSLLH
jgi:hypothetical protein